MGWAVINRMLAHRFYLALILLACAMPWHSILADDCATLANARIVCGEQLNSDNGIFFRDHNRGVMIPRAQVVDVYSYEFYKKVRENRDFWHGLPGIVTFGAGEEFIWDPNGRKGIWKQDDFWMAFKLAGIASSAYFYNEALQDNRQLANSIARMNDRPARQDCRQSYSRFQFSVLLTGSIWFLSALVADHNFGTNAQGASLEITEFSPVRPSDLSIAPPRPVIPEAWSEVVAWTLLL